MSPENTSVAEQVPEQLKQPRKSDIPRGVIAEWTVTIILLLFGTTTLVQAFVIPTGSMEDTLLIGDHLLVDKLAYAPPGPLTKRLLPYEDVHRGDIIVFRYPVDIKQTFVKPADDVKANVFKVEVALNADDVKKYNGNSWMSPGAKGMAKIHLGERPHFQLWTHRLVNWVRMKVWQYL